MKYLMRHDYKVFSRQERRSRSHGTVTRSLTERQNPLEATGVHLKYR